MSLQDLDQVFSWEQGAAEPNRIITVTRLTGQHRAPLDWGPGRDYLEPGYICGAQVLRERPGVYMCRYHYQYSKYCVNKIRNVPCHLFLYFCVYVDLYIRKVGLSVYL